MKQTLYSMKDIRLYAISRHKLILYFNIWKEIQAFPFSCTNIMISSDLRKKLRDALLDEIST